MITLYNAAFSVSSQKVRMALAEKNQPWIDRQVDLLAGGQFQPEFLALNRKAEVPVMIHGQAVLTESAAINEYIEETFDGVPLLPASALGRHAVRAAIAEIDKLAHTASGVMTYVVLARPMLAEVPPAQLQALFAQSPDRALLRWRQSVLQHGFAAPEVAQALDSHRALFAMLEARLESQHAWLAAGQFSLADIAALPYVMRADHVGLGELFPMDTHPNLRSWYMRMLTRPSIKPSILDYVDAPAQELLMNLVMAAALDLSDLMQNA